MNFVSDTLCVTVAWKVAGRRAWTRFGFHPCKLLDETLHSTPLNASDGENSALASALRRRNVVFAGLVAAATVGGKDAATSFAQFAVAATTGRETP